MVSFLNNVLIAEFILNMPMVNTRVECVITSWKCEFGLAVVESFDRKLKSIVSRKVSKEKQCLTKVIVVFLTLYKLA